MGGKFVDKLIIHHGDRVTEHELREGPLTIGRDPECDLFFADKKLYRKHARVERPGDGSTVYLTADAPPLPEMDTVVLAPEAAEKSFPPPATVTLTPDDSSTV